MKTVGKRIFLVVWVITLMFGFVIQKAYSQQITAEYECYLINGNSKGILKLYNNGTCEMFQNDRQIWVTNPSYYRIENNVLKIRATDKNGIVCEVTYTMIPDNLNGQIAYRTRWVSFFDGGMAMFSTIFSPLGGTNDDGSISYDGRMVRIR